MTIIRSTPVAAGEGTAYVDFVITLDAAASAEVKVSYVTDAGSATHAGSQDYVYQSGTLSFAPGETSKSVRVLLSDGTVAEGTEVFWLDLYSPVNATVAQRYIPAFIVDNSGTPSPAPRSPRTRWPPTPRCWATAPSRRPACWPWRARWTSTPWRSPASSARRSPWTAAGSRCLPRA